MTTRARILANMVDSLLTAGTLFANRFEVDRPAGSGGMGTVYRARDRHRGEVVALKILHAGPGAPEESERFVREAQLLSELRHPGIVSHIAHGQGPLGQRFLAMEWLEGEDLGQRLLRGPLPLPDCVRLLAGVAEALAVAHQRGILHRDLKPSNLFLVGGDVAQVKLLDFGIARRIATSQAMTRTGVVVGTPEYMAPEQARGVRQLSAAADLFSLGCVLYECLIGEPPFVAEHIAAVLARILFEEPVPVPQRRPGVPAALVALLGRLLRKDPAQRLGDAMDLHRELQSLGAVQETEQATTLVRPKPQAASFAENEQSLFSIVLAAPPEAAETGDGTLPPSDLLQGAQRQSLQLALQSMGVAADFLVSGALVVTVPTLGSATDQATWAGRAALLIKDRWPAAVVSLATGRGAFQGRTAVGEVVEAAARALKKGQPLNTSAGVFVDTLSAKLLKGRFAQTPRPGGALLLGEEREIDASQPLLGKPTTCIGRDPELANLEAQLSACIEESAARAILVTAPPGMGKSRLRHEFIRRIAKRSESLTRLVSRGDLTGAGDPYGMLRDAIHKLCGFTGSESLADQQERLRTRIGQHVPAAEQDRVVLFVGELCGIPFPDEGKPVLQAARQDPKVMRDALRSAALDWLRAECEAAPVLLILDDLHWGDALTVALLDEALRALHGAPLFVMALGRPEIQETFPKLWSSHKPQEIQLKGLSRKACERLIEQVLGKNVPATTMTRLVEQSAGNALFLEELIRSVAEGEAEEYPETVVAMLQARIGRLNTGPRRAARAAAVFGQTFWKGGVAALLGVAEESLDLEVCLAALMDAEMIEPHASSRMKDETEYGFRHSLTRDAAYSLLTPQDLATGHHLAGEFLASRAESDPGQTAEHFALAGVPDRAVHFFVKAATQQLERFDLDQVLRCVQRGQELGATGHALGELLALQSQVALFRNDWFTGALSGLRAFELLPHGVAPWCNLVGSLVTIYAFSNQQESLVHTMNSFISATPEPDARAAYIHSAKVAIASALSMLGMHTLGRAVLLRMREVGDGRELFQAHYDSAVTSYQFYLGDDPWIPREASLRAVATFSQVGDRNGLAISLGHLAYSETELGAWEHCERTLQRLSELVQRLNEPLWIISTQTFRAQYLTCRMEPESMDEAESLISNILESGVESPFFAGLGQICRSQVLRARGMLDEAEQAGRAALVALAGLNSLKLRAMTCLLEVLNAQKKIEEALALAEDLREQSQNFGGPSGCIAVPLLLAVSESFHAAGDSQRGRSQLAEARRELQVRAARIPDPAWRATYLTRNPYCARAQRLAKEWAVGAE